MGLTDTIKAIKEGSSNALSDLSIKNRLEKIFIQTRRKYEHRWGLHASSIIASDNEFCYREQVLSLFYEQTQGEELPFKVQNIFQTGDDIHEKWQNTFSDAEIAIGIEQRRYSPKYDFFLTPDAIVILNNTTYVVEIKSMNTYQFQKLTDLHPTAKKQIQIYLHFLGIPNGIILVEDKNTQMIKVFTVEYDIDLVSKYLHRLHKVMKFKKTFIKKKKMVKGICSDPNCKRAERCNMRDACFNIGIGRKELEK